jgi:hypothetical protein
MLEIIFKIVEMGIKSLLEKCKKEDISLSDYIKQNQDIDIWDKIKDLSELIDEIPDGSKMKQQIIERFENIIEILEN